MPIFTKGKDQRPPTPRRCHRCRERMGAVHLHFTAPPDVRLAAGEREAWICDECLDAVRRGTLGN
jgi:predicted RNA-binding protein with PUA domain